MAWPISWSQRGIWKPWSGYQERVHLLMVFSAISSWETRTLTTTTLLTSGINNHLFKCMKKWMLRKGELLAQGHRLVRSNAMLTPHSCLWPPYAKYETHLWAGNLSAAWAQIPWARKRRLCGEKGTTEAERSQWLTGMGWFRGRMVWPRLPWGSSIALFQKFQRQQERKFPKQDTLKKFYKTYGDGREA